VLQDSMTYDPVQVKGQGHGDPKAAKMADFKVYFHCRYACNQKRLMVNYDTSRQTRQIFDIPISVSRDLQT